MKAGTARTIGAVCAIITVAVVLLTGIWKAASKLSALETGLANVTERLKVIEGILRIDYRVGDSHGGEAEAVDRFAGGAPWLEKLGGRELELGLPLSGEGDGEARPALLHADGENPSGFRCASGE